MSFPRHPGLFAVVIAGLCSLLLPVTASATPTTPVPYCGVTTTRCIVSVTRNGTPVLAGDPGFTVQAD